MKGVFIINTNLHDIVFMSMDGALRGHFVQIAVNRGLIQVPESGNADTTLSPDPLSRDTTLSPDPLSPDLLVQFLVPLFNSQNFLIEEMNTAYRSITCENGFLFVFAQYFGHVFLAINGSGDETEEFLGRKLAVLNRIVTLVVGPVIKELKPRSMHERKSRWHFIGQLLDGWCHLYNTEQCFLCEGLEQLNLTEELNGKCTILMERTVESIRKSTRANVEHALLIINNKILTTYSSPRVTSSIFTSDKLLLILLVHVLRYHSTDSCSDKHGGNHRGTRHRPGKSTSTKTTSADSPISPLPENPSPKLIDIDTIPAAEGYSSVKLNGHSDEYGIETCFEPAAVRPASGVLSGTTAMANPVYESDASHFTSISLSLERPKVDGRDSVNSEFDPANTMAENFPETSRMTCTPCLSEAADPLVPGLPPLPETPEIPADFTSGEEEVFDTDSCGCSRDVDKSDVEGEHELVCGSYRRVNVFLQEGPWKHSPHTIHCLQLDNNMTLVIVCELVHKPHARLLSNFMELVLNSINGRWMSSFKTASSIEAAIDGCVKSLAQLTASYIELQSESVIGQLVEELTATWQSAKLEDFARKLQTGRDDRLLRSLRTMYGHTVDLFRVIFLRPRLLSDETIELWRSIMLTTKLNVNASLSEFRNFVDAVVHSSPSAQSLLLKFRSVEHFIYIDRNVNLMVAPLMNLSDDNGRQRLKKLVWQMFDTMRRDLINGHNSTIVQTRQYTFAYCFSMQDARGNQFSLNEQVLSDVAYTNMLPGTLCQPFYRHVMKRCSPPPARCHELFCVFMSPVANDYVYQCMRTLVSRLNRLVDSTQSTTPFVLF